MNQLAHRSFPFRRMLFAVKVFRNHPLGGQNRPGFRYFDVLLFENNLPAIVGDFGGALVPFNLVKRLDSGIAKNPFNGQRFYGNCAAQLAPRRAQKQSFSCDGEPGSRLQQGELLQVHQS